MTDGPLLSRDDVTSLLRELSEELVQQDVKGRLFVVGGAAMALAYGRDRLTQDVDAVFEPKEVVYEAARLVAERHPDLPEDWLNDAAKGYVLGDDPDATTYLDEPGLSVQIASPEYLFVMKALAARVERDTGDLLLLYRRCGFTSVDEALEAVERRAPRQLLRPKTVFLLREILSELEGDAHPDGRDHE